MDLTVLNNCDEKLVVCFLAKNNLQEMLLLALVATSGFLLPVTLALE